MTCEYCKKQGMWHYEIKQFNHDSGVTFAHQKCYDNHNPNTSASKKR